MIKKISIARLRPGMFVAKLDDDWISHPLLRRCFMLKTPENVRRVVASGVRYVYIDTAKGLDDEEAVCAESVHRAIEQEMRAALQSPAQPAALGFDVQEELGRARTVAAQARQVVGAMMHDARLGKALTLNRAEPVIEAISGSILRNRSALLGLVGIKNKDDYTFQHSVSVCTLMIAFAWSLGLGDEALRQAGIGGLLHDIGKMKVPDAILNKPGSLTKKELALIRRHPADGHAILAALPGIGPVPLDITLHHHERLDGSGYPHRLAGDQISTMARMAAIVDVYDAITANRCYRVSMPPTEALRNLWEWSATQYDRQLLQGFLRCVGIYPVGSLVRLESGRLGVVIEQNQDNLLTPKLRVFFNTQANAHIETELIDLSRGWGAGGGDHIVSAESPARWGVDPQQFLFKE